MPRSYPQVLLLVDGYNVIGAWSSLKNTRDRQGLDSARQELIEALINYSAFEGYQTEIVFDAQYTTQVGDRETITDLLSVYYTDFRQTADTYIEKFCADYQRQVYRSSPRLIVATSDRAQQQTILGYGAEWLSALQLANEVELSSRRTRRKHRPQKQTRGRFLFNSLDAQAQERLVQMRFGVRK
ncbi:MAG: NYN domain-containing protein [Oscillatoria sp. PMC 1068.18]|nr:NYN domain-containing protein [Oscillatoria sp. PMC 1076.18]MEC4988979.1 NYN domain-containing protein [Oscillatoria sp. PMC 1068.18]